MNRIVAIDTLRGVALLGILLMNIRSFAMPASAYANLKAYFGETLPDQIAFSLTHILVDQKAMALFSLLFGASVMLLIRGRAEKGLPTAWHHHWRNTLLLIIGLLHGLYLWEGDNLFVYAVCAYPLYACRNWQPRFQCAVSLLIFLVPSAANMALHASIASMSTSDRAQLAAYWHPSKHDIKAEIALYGSRPYTDQVDYRAGDLDLSKPKAPDGPLVETADGMYLLDAFCRAMGMMLIGMALYTGGVLTGKRSARFYRRLVYVGCGVGFPIALAGLWQLYRTAWHWEYALFLGGVPNSLATLLIVSGYIGAVMLWCRSPRGQALKERLALVGRTALSNYLAQSVMCTVVFYSYGLGLFGDVNRATQLVIVVLIWIVQLQLSAWWLTRYRFGPVEWLWRSLTYFTFQPLRRSS
ncbi:MAG: DUF418 domain-containing protein [Pseudomonadota bacterium]